MQVSSGHLDARYHSSTRIELPHEMYLRACSLDSPPLHDPKKDLSYGKSQICSDIAYPTMRMSTPPCAAAGSDIRTQCVTFLLSA